MNNTISITKGIAIILMVIGHAGCPTLLHNFIYAFHMPLFFFVSGYLFKEKYFDNPKEYIVKRLKGLYVPFVKWSLLFLILQNIFYQLGLFESNYSLQKIGETSINILLFRGGYVNLLGGYWYLIEAFYVACWAFGILWIIEQFRKKYLLNKHTFQIVNISIILVCVILCYLFSVIGVSLPKLTHRTLLSLSMLFVGYNFKQIDFKAIINYVALACFIICLTRVLLLPEAMSINTIGWLVFPYCITAIMGIIMTLFVANEILHRLPKLSIILEYIGNNTLYILTFHFLSFRMVQWWILRYTENTGNMYDFPVIPNLGGGWWLLYSLIGVLCPLAIHKILVLFKIQ